MADWLGVAMVAVAGWLQLAVAGLLAVAGYGWLRSIVAAGWLWQRLWLSLWFCLWLWLLLLQLL